MKITPTPAVGAFEDKLLHIKDLFHATMKHSFFSVMFTAKVQPKEDNNKNSILFLEVEVWS